MIRRRSIDPDLLNEFAIQTFHSENKKSHLKPPSVHNHNDKDCCVVEICPSLTYPEIAHVSARANPILGDTISEAPPENQEIKAEKPFDTRSMASSIDLCPICLDQYEDGDSKIRVLPCTHYFHQECIDSWLLRENTTTNCPCCNFDLSTIPRAENRPSPDTSRRFFWWICSSS
ncbi:hypothetical protein K450DRAFT_255487 [Umbelopsis ramanniana AG]|uniref:RING-type domain-containing protein n=1 Tax=Umbelopsis ramanniana AG TaxID=1314678 RepID=A0AAD5HBE7_UMBRA|nr:uncharacterized protein K450DRAFT_255487 [Umbelopsis ramanniana AG]KAI8576764.1 hypothetical protein K450DRAFT_255487 [Umbelopsis ramanniana AG]